MNKFKLEIEGSSNKEKIRTSYYSSAFLMAFASRPIDGKRYQVTSMQTCRDYAQEFIRLELQYKSNNPKVKKIKNLDYYGYFPNENIRLDLNKLRLLVFSISHNTNKNFYDNNCLDETMSLDTKDIEKRVFFAKKIINFYEETFGWTKSKIIRTKHKDVDPCWHVMGPKEWMLNPHMLSLATITLRASIRYGEFEFSTVEDIADNYKRIVTSNTSIPDYHILMSVGKHISNIVNNYNYIFEGLTPEDIYKVNGQVHRFHSSGGIKSLCDATTEIKTVNDRVLEVTANTTTNKGVIDKNIKTADNKPAYM